MNRLTSSGLLLPALYLQPVYPGTLSPEGFQAPGPDPCRSEFDPSERVFHLYNRVEGAEAFARAAYTGPEGLAFEKFPG